MVSSWGKDGQIFTDHDQFLQMLDGRADKKTDGPTVDAVYGCENKVSRRHAEEGLIFPTMNDVVHGHMTHICFW